MRIIFSVLVFLLIGSDLVAQDRRPIKVLTWNIYMRQNSILWNRQFRRAKAIGKLLQKEDYDIVLFQEAFGKVSRKKLRKALDGLYAIEIEPKNNKKP